MKLTILRHSCIQAAMRWLRRCGILARSRRWLRSAIAPLFYSRQKTKRNAQLTQIRLGKSNKIRDYKPCQRHQRSQGSITWPNLWSALMAAFMTGPGTIPLLHTAAGRKQFHLAMQSSAARYCRTLTGNWSAIHCRSCKCN